MSTGPEMLIGTLIKLFKLEPEIEKIKAGIKQASDEDLIGQAKQALETVRSFDERFSRLERHLGIATGPGTDDIESGTRFDRFDPPQLTNGTNRFRS